LTVDAQQGSGCKKAREKIGKEKGRRKAASREERLDAVQN